ncbi:MAG: cbb3-type cytochrome c oxidase subunit 3 [Alphaproteobacteria bacterium]|nr:cbb3-type cytochrome c oxidase subunit 3 [Alphaproteobacteria bacterium]
MSYDTVATFSQVSSLLLFIALFVGVIAYVFWPTTKDKLELAQRRALDLDGKNDHSGGRQVR